MSDDDSRVKVDQGAHGTLVRAARDVRAGEAVLHLDGEILETPGRHTLQLHARRHLLNRSEPWVNVNHSCEPNLRVDIEGRRMVAIRDIPAGTELRFDYNTTEWDMATPFACGCGAPSCVGTIRGFRHLGPTRREAIRPWLSPLLLSRFHERG